MKRVFLTLAAWLLSLAVLMPICFFVVMILAGPHSSVLPSMIQPAVLILGWVAVLVAPMMIAGFAWQRAGR